ncbi:MAG: DUF721 domain-containing protein [Candidatus Hydrogenedentota bacterium]
MHKDTPEAIKHILEGLKVTSELGRTLDEARIWEHWESIVPSPFNAHTYPLRVKKQVLFIEADNAVWMHKTSYLKQQILDRIRSTIPPETIEDLRFVLEDEEKQKKLEK